MTVTARQPVIDAPATHPTPARVRAHRAAFAGLLVLTGLLYLESVRKRLGEQLLFGGGAGEFAKLDGVPFRLGVKFG